MDDYEPLDPTYLPPGLEEETSGDGGGDKQEGGEEEEEGESGEAPAKKTKLDGGEARTSAFVLDFNMSLFQRTQSVLSYHFNVLYV